MDPVLQPWFFTWRTVFTNRKHRQRVLTIPLTDAAWELREIVNLTPAGLRFTVHICDAGGRQISHTGIEIRGALPLVPALPYPRGSQVQVTATLDPAADVGRKRPKAWLEFRGVKTYGRPA